MALDETSIGLFTTFLILDISNNDVGIALENSTLYFDLKLENCTPMLSLAFLSLAEEEPLALMFTLDETSNGIGGFTFTQDGDWYRCALDFSQLEEAIGMSFVGMMFNIYSDSIHSESAFWLDNMTLDEAEIEDVEVDEDDLATPDILTTSIIADWNMHSDLVLQNKVVSTNSTSALRGSFNVADADDWYDSSNDPNGDGGPWVWTVVTLDLTEIFGCTVGLNGVALTFDVKTVNCDVTSSIILLKADGTKSTQLPFNQDPENPGVASFGGYYKEILENGWVRITADFDTLFGADANEVSTICLIFSNAYGDYENDSVFYLDNMMLD